MNAAADARETLFGDMLSCEEVRPAAFLAAIPDNLAPQSLNARGEALLRALAVIEDGVRNEEPEQPGDHALQRMEAKIDLLTLLVAGLSPGADADPLQSLQWSARGARLGVERPLPAGTAGLFRIRLADWLPSPLLLPATVIACQTDAAGASNAWLRFDPLSPALQAALERHLFRIHRRAIAESRRPR